MLRLLAALVISTAVAGCSGERTPPASGVPESGTASAQPRTGLSAAGEKALRIEPAEVRKGTPVRLSATGIPLERAAVEWLVNGETAAGVPDTGALRRGDTLQARAIGAWGTAVSQVVTVTNSSPELRSARFGSGDRQPSDLLRVEAEAFDADGDPVRFEITWKKNGETAGSGPRMQTPVQRGDKVQVTIVPFDGEGPGRPISLTREILNTPPTIQGHDRFQVDGNVVSFHVLASDADGDPLTYSIKEAPPGMRIDPVTGRVRWETSADTKGKIPSTIVVSDGAGGETSARINVTIREENTPKAP